MGMPLPQEFYNKAIYASLYKKSSTLFKGSLKMNTSEIKKTVWAINVFVFIIFGSLLYFVYQQLSAPDEKLIPFVYHEPLVNETIKSESKIVSRQEIEKEFGWKEPKKKVEELFRNQVIDEIKTELPKVNSINQLISIEMILGKLAFIQIKKDKQLKSYLVGDEIRDSNNELIGVLKEINEEGVLVLQKDKIETLVIEVDGIFETTTPASVSESLKTTFGIKPREHILNSQPLKRDKENIASKQEVENSLFVVNQEVEADGMIHRKITNELASQLDSKEWYQKMSSAKSYELEFQSKGVLIKNIKDPEAKKVLNAFGILDADIVVSVNGQSLGNKTEDDLILLYQQIKGSAKFATIELIRNGSLQKFKISVKK